MDPPSPSLLSLYTVALPGDKVQLRQRYTGNVVVGGWIPSEGLLSLTPHSERGKESAATAGMLICTKMAIVWLGG